MTIAELRRQLLELQHLPDSTLVVLAKDAEGNGFSPAVEAIPGMYLADTTWSGGHYLTEEQRLAETDPDEWSQAPDDAMPAVFLWPVN
ncbi:hypothetical protein ACFYVK_35170 [Streptomyces chartreusis]|uniref:hypothetical protein n=1 Tax=Streptomyces chartreusis TaxID=1969 RepID=UPI0036B1339E